MKKLMMTALALALAPVLALAAAAPNFSGAWVRDGARSDVVPNPMYWLTRGVDAGGARGRESQVTIEVRHDGGMLQVADPVEPLRTYALDGRPHTVSTDTGIEKATVTAAVQGPNLTIATTQPFGGMPGNAPLTVTETWSLSPDGRELTVTTVRDLPAKRDTYKEVFTRR